MSAHFLPLVVLVLGCNGGDDDVCSWSSPEPTGTVTDGELNEPSGLAKSPLEDVLWTHNDSGDDPRIFAIDTAGTVLAELTVSTVAMGDWEDVAIYSDGPSHELWIGDLGIDGGSPPTLIGMALPLVSDGKESVVPHRVVTIDFPDERPDVEAIFYDQASGRFVLITRAEGGLSEVYEVDPDAGDARSIASLHFGSDALEGDDEVTGAAANGESFAVRTRTSAFLWERGTGSVAEALDEDPCSLPIPAVEGEGLSFDGPDRYYTIGRGPGSSIHRVDRL